jgi:hypothetical protein
MSGRKIRLKKVIISWQFTTTDTQEKLDRHYKCIQKSTSLGDGEGRFFTFLCEKSFLWYALSALRDRRKNYQSLKRVS